MPEQQIVVEAQSMPEAEVTLGLALWLRKVVKSKAFAKTGIKIALVGKTEVRLIESRK